MLSAAILAHVWLLHAPQSTRSVPLQGPPMTLAGTSAPPPPSPAWRVPITSEPSVSLLVEDVVAYPVSSTGIVAESVSLARLRAHPIAATDLTAALREQPAADLRPLDPPTPPAPSVEPAVASEPLAGPASAAPLEALVRTPERTDTDPASLSRAGSRLTALNVQDAQDDVQRQKQVVRQILDEYARAFDRLDVQAAKAVWPSLDDRALQRAFQRLNAQNVQFASCGVSITGPAANARCLGNATYRPKVGSRVMRVTGREWTFNLARSEGGWQIVNATIQ